MIAENRTNPATSATCTCLPNQKLLHVATTQLQRRILRLVEGFTERQHKDLTHRYLCSTNTKELYVSGHYGFSHIFVNRATLLFLFLCGGRAAVPPHAVAQLRSSRARSFHDRGRSHVQEGKISSDEVSPSSRVRFSFSCAS